MTTETGERPIVPASRSAESAQEAQEAQEALRLCDQPVGTPLVLPPGLPDARVRAIVEGASKWLNGTVLHYCFFDDGVHGSDVTWTAPQAQRDVVRRAFETWKALGIGLVFREVTSLPEAEVRIGFDQGDGSWSYLGRQVLQIPVPERTMNFGWDLTANPYGLTTALHEIGHTLGMPHEHQNPFAGIVWDEEAVYASLGGPPNNWPRATTYHNVLRKISPAAVRGSEWDPDSIMQYAFPAGLIREPVAYARGLRPPGDLSPVDREQSGIWYPGEGTVSQPALLQPFVSVPTSLAPAQQVDYRVEPTASRTYGIATFGASDTVLGLFENVDGELRFVAADDDSGHERNASLRHKLFAGRRYVVRVRCYYAQQSATTAVMYW